MTEAMVPAQQGLDGGDATPSEANRMGPSLGRSPQGEPDFS